MKNSPLQLEAYYLTAVHLDSNENAQVKDGQIAWSVESVVSIAEHKQDPRRWKVGLLVKFKPAEGDVKPYEGSASFTGFFAVDTTYPDEKMKMLVETNAPSVLYGAAREMFSNLTARGPWPMVMLPTKSFYPVKPKPPAPQRQGSGVEPAALKPDSKTEK
jgi:preprotein translocase subunit SecB